MFDTSRSRAIVSLAVAQLRHYWGRTLLAVLGIALAVLLVVLLVGLGQGVTTTGAAGLDWIDRDLWVTAGSLQFAPGAVGGVQNPLLDAHETAERIESREDVHSAEPLSFQAVYVSPNRSEFRTIVGVGGTGNASGISLRRGEGFTRGDVHYANGTYEGPMSHEVVIDERTAMMFNVSLGETLHIGGTISNARRNEYTVVGISPTFSTFLGTATVLIPLSELQTLAERTETDPASLIAVTTAQDAEARAVKAAVQRQYPSYSVRTNSEQLNAILGSQGLVIVAAVTIVVISVVVGSMLVLDVLALLVYHQREPLAALKAAGVSERSLFALFVFQGLGISVLGGGIGVLATPVAAAGANRLTEAVVGWTLVSDPPWLMAGGFLFSVFIGVSSAAIAGWQVVGLRPLEHLE